MKAKFVSCEYNIQERDNGVWDGGGPGNRRKGQLCVKCVIQLKNSKLGFETKKKKNNQQHHKSIQVCFVFLALVYPCFINRPAFLLPI